MLSPRSISTVVSLFGVAASLLFTPMQARADTPIQFPSAPFVFTDTLTGACTFPIDIVSTGAGHGTGFVKNGQLVRVMLTNHQQDTYTANGKTLVGEPYTYHIGGDIDANGNVTSQVITGGYGTIPLPDGSVFRAAGRSVRQGLVFVLVPDTGNTRNLAAFCAALAP